MKFEKVSKYEEVKLPKRATKDSAGYDFFLNEDLNLKVDEVKTVATGVKCEIDQGFFLAIFPRSGLGFKYKVRLSNTTGIVDGDYYNNESNEGEIFIKLSNEGDKDLSLQKGEAFAQGIFMIYGITDDDCVTETRKGGLGSTSKNETKSEEEIKLEKAIERQREFMRQEEMSYDFYYTRGTYKEDLEKLSNLQRELSELRSKK